MVPFFLENALILDETEVCHRDTQAGFLNGLTQHIRNQGQLLGHIHIHHGTLFLDGIPSLSTIS